jgi:hypothetical protein
MVWKRAGLACAIVAICVGFVAPPKVALADGFGCGVNQVLTATSQPRSNAYSLGASATITCSPGTFTITMDGALMESIDNGPYATLTSNSNSVDNVSTDQLSLSYQQPCQLGGFVTVEAVVRYTAADTDGDLLFIQGTTGPRVVVCDATPVSLP